MKASLCIYSNRLIVNLFLSIYTYYMVLLVKLSPKASIMQIKMLGEKQLVLLCLSESYVCFLLGKTRALGNCK